MLFNSHSEAIFDLIDEKQTYFHAIIREQQIQNYKNDRRHQLLIHYTNPYLTIQRIQDILLLSTTQHLSTQQIIQIIGLCRNVKNNYQHCALLSNHHIVEKILLTITENTSQQKAIIQWLKLVLDTLDNWPSLWFEFYSQFDQIIWGIVADFHFSDEVIFLCCDIIKQLKQKCHISTELAEHQINFIFSVDGLSPIIFRIMTETMTSECTYDFIQIAQEQLQQPPIISHLLSYFSNPSYQPEVIGLLENIGFLYRELLDGLNQYLSNQSQGNQNCFRILKILYEQTYYQEEELINLGNKCESLRNWIQVILENDE